MLNPLSVKTTKLKVLKQETLKI